MNELLKLKESLTKEKEELLIQLEKARAEPDRLTRQAESIEKAANGFENEFKVILRKIKITDADLEKQTKKIQESEKLKENLTEKLEFHKQTLLQRENDCSIIRKQLETEKLTNHELLTQKVEYNLKVKEIDSDIRHKNDEINMVKKEYELLKRQYKKKRGIVDQTKAIIPQLEEQKLTQEHVMRSYREECEAIKKKISTQQEEVELGIGQLLQQENSEKLHNEVVVIDTSSLVSSDIPSLLFPSIPFHSLGTSKSNKRSRTFRK